MPTSHDDKVGGAGNGLTTGTQVIRRTNIQSPMEREAKAGTQGRISAPEKKKSVISQELPKKESNPTQVEHTEHSYRHLQRVANKHAREGGDPFKSQGEVAFSKEGAPKPKGVDIPGYKPLTQLLGTNNGSGIFGISREREAPQAQPGRQGVFGNLPKQLPPGRAADGQLSRPINGPPVRGMDMPAMRQGELPARSQGMSDGPMPFAAQPHLKFIVEKDEDDDAELLKRVNQRRDQFLLKRQQA